MKLLVLDVEGTLFQTKVRLPGAEIDSTIWQSLAQSLGPEAAAREVETHRRWRAGEYAGYIEWMRDTIRIHQDHHLHRDHFRRVIAAAEYNPGVAEFFAELDRARYEPVLVTGGFRELAPSKPVRHAGGRADDCRTSGTSEPCRCARARLGGPVRRLAGNDSQRLRR